MIDEIKIPQRIAKVICEMEEVCFSEGIGPDSSELMLWIKRNYPDLAKEYSYLPWPGYEGET